MNIITYSAARNNLKSVLDQVVEDAEITVISRKNGQNIVVMRQEHYESIIETLYLLSSSANAARLNKSIAELNSAKKIK